MQGQLRASIYTRVSTVAQVVDGSSLDTQEMACRFVAAAIPAEVVFHRQDAGVSGELYMSRPGIQAALEDIRTKRADILICYKLDRSGRNVDVVRAIAKAVSQAGGRLFFTDDGEVSYGTGTGRAVFTMKAVFAELERSTIRERSMAGKRHQAENGIQPNRGMRPYGYRIITTLDVLKGEYPLEMAGKYVLDPDEAPHAKKLFDLYASGHSLRHVARVMQDAGVLPPSHAPDRLARYETPPRKIWHPESIRSILLNPIYIGTGAVGKRKRIVDESRVTDPDSKYKRPDYNPRQPRENWMLIPGVAPPLIDAATFNTCQDRLNSNQRTQSGNPQYRFLMTGLMVCPNCKRGLYGARSRKGGKTYVSYRCRDYSRTANTSGVICNKHHYPEIALKKQLFTVLRLEPDLVSAAFDSYIQRNTVVGFADELRDTERQLMQCTAKEEATAQAEIAAIEAGRDVTVYHRILGEVQDKRTRLSDRRAYLLANAGDVPKIDVKGSTAVIAESLSKLDAVLQADEITTAEKNDLISKVISKIEPHENDTEFELYPLKTGATVKRMVIRLS